MNFETNNDELVDYLLEGDYIKTDAVENVFRAVDRGLYFTADSKDCAYADVHFREGNVYICAPSFYSHVMENLELAPGMSFLNLGSGTGYLSTMAGLILGSYGINHGIEVDEEVLDYARRKLNEFCSTSIALDEYEFCQPIFVRGNCLDLGCKARLYDRVFCGAICSENHLNCVKFLVKIGGILVMPVDDKLLQIRRISDAKWKSKYVFPVCFDDPICSHVPHTAESVQMPDAEPLSLQDICRFAVRSILRRKIDMEHPELKKKPSRVRRQRRVKKIIRETFVMPSSSSHSDGEGDDAENEDRAGIRDFERREFLMDNHNMRTSGTLPGRSIDNDEETQESPGRRTAAKEGESEKEGSEESAEREYARDECTSDCGNESSPKIAVDEDDVMKCGIEAAESPVAERWPERSDCRSLADQTREAEEGKREKFDSGIVEDMEDGKGTSSDCEYHSKPGHSKNSQHQNLSLKFEDCDTEATASETSPREAASETRNTEKSESETGSVKNYSSYMREKINMLPLPMKLKYFVNLDRKL